MNCYCELAEMFTIKKNNPPPQVPAISISGRAPKQQMGTTDILNGTNPSLRRTMARKEQRELGRAGAVETINVIILV